jgi:hypothetical protein
MFLIHVLNFLGENPTEIVFFEVRPHALRHSLFLTPIPQIKSDGFAILRDSFDAKSGKTRVVTMVPTLAELDATLERARVGAGSAAAREVVVGTPADLGRSIGELLESNTRLIVANRVHFPDDWARADSYSTSWSRIGWVGALSFEWCRS